MKISMLIASEDKIYTERVSEYISQHYADTFDISVCGSPRQIEGILTGKRYNAALIDESYAKDIDPQCIDLPLLLWTGLTAGNMPESIKHINKHKRISSTVANVLEQLAVIAKEERLTDIIYGNITAVWSPCGGIGKTTIALAAAASKAAQGKKVFYLNLEDFASTPVYFSRPGKSISEVFEMLDKNEGNVKMFIQGICGNEDGVDYLYIPDNYEDISILTDDIIKKLLLGCAAITGELIADMPSSGTQAARQVFETADKILLVTGSTETAAAKMSQFMSQSNLYEQYKEKMLLIENKSPAQAYRNTAAQTDGPVSEAIYIPYIQTGEEQSVYKAIAKMNLIP